MPVRDRNSGDSEKPTIIVPRRMPRFVSWSDPVPVAVGVGRPAEHVQVHELDEAAGVEHAVGRQELGRPGEVLADVGEAHPAEVPPTQYQSPSWSALRRK